jgi:glutathione S-transferase
LGPLTRARIDFFVETWDSKVGTYWFQIITADKVKEKAELARAFVAAVEKDIEPLLKDVNPFFGGSEHITFSEVRGISRFTLWSA